jgi:hypothetical protein
MGYGEGVLATKKGACEMAPFLGRIDGRSFRSRSFVIQVGLLIPAVQLAADREHYRP